MFCLKTQSEKQGRDLSATLVGAILQGAALLDDIVALVLLTVITALGEGDGSNNGLGWTIGQPIVASIGMAVVGPLFTFYVARPLFRRSLLESWVEKGGRNAQLLIGVAVLCAHLAIAYYIHTTMLLGAFLAGVFLFALPSPSSSVNFAKTYEHLVEPVHKYILAPLFFSSIGFTIPCVHLPLSKALSEFCLTLLLFPSRRFLELWTGQVVWRGIVYSILMTLAKVAVGLSIVFIDLVTKPYANVSVASSAAVGSPREHSATSSSTTVPIPVSSSTDVEQPDGDYDVSVKAANVAEQAGTTGKTSTAGAMARFEMLQTETLPAAAFLGFALVARGEIGVSASLPASLAPLRSLTHVGAAVVQVLILQVAYNAAPPGSTTSTEENGGSRVLGTEAYLVAIWATALCTIIGPVVFSAVVKRYGRAIYQGRWGKLRKGEEI